jgi:hypothetical protein
MRIEADLKCLMCGHLLGEVDADRRQGSVAIRRFRAGPLYRGPSATMPQRRDKCGGALMLDEVEVLGQADTVAAAA